MFGIFKREPIVAGDIWQDKDECKDPWGTNKGKVEILDYKEKWVRYKWLNSDMWKDERMKEGIFRYIYKKVEK